MMAVAASRASLVERLERRSESSGCCDISQYERDALEIRRGARFPATLKRAKALADESRLLAAALLKRHGEMCACEIQAAMSLSHPTVSHHMSVLADAGIVAEERRGKWIYYRLKDRIEVGVP